LILPETARELRWVDSKRVVTRAMPVPKKSSTGSTVFWITGVIFLVIGVLLTAASFLLKPVPVSMEDKLPKIIEE
jgi:hypothetical protein